MHKFWGFGGLLGAVRGHIVELECGVIVELVSTGKSNYMCRVATISLHLAVWVLGRFLSKKKKRLILA